MSLGSTKDIELIKVPGQPEIWRVGDNDFRIVYYVPGSDPKIPVFYKADKKAMEAIFGPDQAITWDRQVTEAQVRQQGAIYFGQHDELANLTSDPITALRDQIEKEQEVRPWLNDVDVVAVLLEATLEGRAPTEAEFQRTEWWQHNNESQRSWLLLNASDPSTAQQRLESNRINARNMLIESGVWEPSESMVNYMADRFTRGDWTDTYLKEQVKWVSDPGSPAKADAGLEQWLTAQGMTPDRTMGDEDTVRDMVNTWLGPAYGQWNEGQIQEWATRLRNDTDGKQLLEKQLSAQRLSLFPEYSDPNRTYQDIASGWRSVFQQEWGQMPDETKPMFLDIVRANDLGTAQRSLRTEGLKVGNNIQTQKFVNELTGTFNRTAN